MINERRSSSVKSTAKPGELETILQQHLQRLAEYQPCCRSREEYGRSVYLVGS